MSFRRGHLDMSYVRAAPGRWNLLAWACIILVSVLYLFGAWVLTWFMRPGVTSVVLLHLGFWTAAGVFLLGRRAVRGRRLFRRGRQEKYPFRV